MDYIIFLRIISVAEQKSCSAKIILSTLLPVLRLWLCYVDTVSSFHSVEENESGSESGNRTLWDTDT